MTLKTTAFAFAAACALLSSATANAQVGPGSRTEYLARLAAERGQAQAPAPGAVRSATRRARASLTKTAAPGAARATIVKQTTKVSTSCFPASLRRVLADLKAHFGKPVIVTSGFRSKAHNRRAGGAARSFHTSCMAADIQIAGVRPAAIARFARAHPSVGGVGTYRHTRSVHVDVGVRVASWGGRGAS